MNIGIGYDIHRLVKGQKLRLGGLTIPHPAGLSGHSDGDALLHAVADALLGAAGLGDIGEHFPDSDPRYKNAESAIFLKEISRLLKKSKWAIVNVDAIVIAERPKLSPYKKKMAANIAWILKISPSAVSVKAKTHEGLGDIGKGRAIACQAIASLSKGK